MITKNILVWIFITFYSAFSFGTEVEDFLSSQSLVSKMRAIGIQIHHYSREDIAILCAFERAYSIFRDLQDILVFQDL